MSKDGIIIIIIIIITYHPSSSVTGYTSYTVFLIPNFLRFF